MRSMKTGVLAAALLVLGMGAASAEMQVGVYGGFNESFDSDVHIVQPDGTSLEFSDVPWDGVSFEAPPYYGVRATYWLNNRPNWGIALDYTHAKVKAEKGETVDVTGEFQDVPVNGTTRVGDFFRILEFTDGLNLVLLNAMYRLDYERWVPYAGVGVGLSIPHVEYARFDQPFRTFDYQVAGVAVQGLVGLEFKVTDRISAFGEYKLSYAEVDGDLEGGGSLETDVVTNHFVLGVSYRFGGGAAYADPYK